MADEHALVVRGPAIPSVEVLANMREVAEAVVTARLCPKGCSPDQALVMMVKGYELGIGLMQSMSDIFVVHGQASLSTKLMLKLYRDAGHRFTVLQKDRDCCSVRLILADGQIYAHAMTREEATEARFDQQWDKDTSRWKLKHTWKGMPVLMLFYRTMSSGIRMYAPECLFDTPTRDEAESLSPEELAALRVNGYQRQADEEEPIEADWSEEPETEPTGPTLDERVEDYTRRTTRTLEERIEELQTVLVQLRAEERRAQLEAAEAAKQAQLRPRKALLATALLRSRPGNPTGRTIPKRDRSLSTRWTRLVSITGMRDKLSQTTVAKLWFASLSTPRA